MTLFGVELSRFRSRRAVVLILLAGALLAVVVAGKTMWDTRPLTAADIATAQAQANIDAANPTVKNELDQCVANPGDYLGPGGTEEQCRIAMQPNPQAYLSRQPLSLREVLDGNGMSIALLLVGLVVIAGSTYAGADWSTGSLTNQLLYEPRRRRVWTAKALAVGLFSGLFTLVVLGGFWVALYFTAVARELPHGGAVRSDVTLAVLRVVALAIGAGVGAYALTMLFRSTVATLALLFAYSIGGEVVVSLLPNHGVARWSVGNNVSGWVQNNFHYFDPTVRCRTGDCSQLRMLDHLDAGSFLLVLLVVAAVISLVSFSRRDI
jgi:ABC-2 type transport system permease protein